MSETPKRRRLSDGQRDAILEANGLDDAEIGRMQEAMIREAPRPVRATLGKEAFARNRETLLSILVNFGLREAPERLALEALHADHLQAREHVELLAKMLREIVDDDAAALHKGREAKVRALLAEVEP